MLFVALSCFLCFFVAFCGPWFSCLAGRLWTAVAVWQLRMEQFFLLTLWWSGPAVSWQRWVDMDATCKTVSGSLVSSPSSGCWGNPLVANFGYTSWAKQDSTTHLPYSYCFDIQNYQYKKNRNSNNKIQYQVPSNKSTELEEDATSNKRSQDVHLPWRHVTRLSSQVTLNGGGFFCMLQKQRQTKFNAWNKWLVVSCFVFNSLYTSFIWVISEKQKTNYCRIHPHLFFIFSFRDKQWKDRSRIILSDENKITKCYSLCHMSLFICFVVLFYVFVVFFFFFFFRVVWCEILYCILYTFVWNVCL